METEGDLVTAYVMADVNMGTVSLEWMNDYDVYAGIPSLKEVQSAPFQRKFQRTVDKRIKFYKRKKLNVVTYTSRNRGVKPKAFESIIKTIK